ncbi:hypothetical protein [Paludibacterium denitrificans]|uniref:Lipoprotein n=1 Tax=Paludibacterium denitrificans TaxID=2675226 RepID=A0A844GDF9_9NEIS|nr:hypothetical protein [Paludibacterium denitrificans]MTD33689.1 hypothetical protein [Paludibacterium denitrificans]
MKFILAVLIAFTAAGCATHKETFTSTNPNELFIGKKPDGYPKTYIEPYPGYPGFCLDVKETLREDHFKGQTIWLKDKYLRSVDCPQ